MPDQDLVARTLANPEYWNKKSKIETKTSIENFKRLAQTGVRDANQHYTDLADVQEQLKGTKLNIYLHTEFQTMLQDAQSFTAEAKHHLSKGTPNTQQLRNHVNTMLNNA